NNRIAQDHDWVVTRHIEGNELDSRRRYVCDHAARTRYDDRAITSARKDACKLNRTSVGSTDVQSGNDDERHDRTAGDRGFLSCKSPARSDRVLIARFWHLCTQA